MFSLHHKTQCPLHFFCHGGRFYNRYINTADKKKYLDDDGSGVKPNHLLQRGMKCMFFGDTLKAMWDRDSKISKDNFGRKIKATGCIFFLGQISVKLKVACQ